MTKTTKISSSTVIKEILSLFFAVLVFLLIGTYPLNIIGAVSFYLLIKCINHYFFTAYKNYSIFLPDTWPRLSIYIIGIMASLVIVLVPSYPITMSSASIWNTFGSLSLPAILKVISGYFILGIFPGYVIYDTLLRRSDFRFILKICLIPALSFIVVVIIGLALQTIGLDVTSRTFFASLWGLILVIMSIRFIRRNGNASHIESRKKFSFTFDVFLLLLMGTILVLFAYVTVFSAHPFSGYLNYDPPSYFSFANQAMNFGPIERLPYVWFPVFLWVSQVLTGLPMLYAFVGMQFYEFLLPLVFYVFLDTILKSKRLAVAGAFLFFFASSNNSLAFLWSGFNHPDIFSSYLSGDYLTRYNTLLTYYYDKLGTSLAFPVILSPTTIDLIFAFLAMTFFYKYLTSEKNTQRKTELILAGAFWAASLYSHNIFLALPVLLTVMMYCLIANKSLTSTCKVLGSALFFGIVFELLSRLYQFNYNFFPVFLSADGNFLNLLSHPEIFVPTFGLFGYLLIVFLRHRFLLSRPNSLPCRLSSVIKMRTVRVFFWLVGLSVTMLAVYFFVTNFGAISRNQSSWYTIILGSYAVTLPLAIGGLPSLLGKLNKSSIVFILCWISSYIFGILISFFSVEIDPYWYIFLLMYPIACLAAFGINDLINFLRKPNFLQISIAHNQTSNKFKKYLKMLFGHALIQIVSVLIIISIGISFLSLAYSHEFTLVAPNFLTNESETEVYNWMNNNLQKNTVILPLSENSYLTLNSMVSNVRVLPLAYEFSPTWFSYAWIWNLLVNSTSPETILYILSYLNVSCVYATENDLAAIQAQGGSTLCSVIKAFPVEFGNSYATLYSVPAYPLTNDSNYVLVESLFDSQQANNLEVFDLLLQLGNKFSVVPDVELNNLKKNCVYFFPLNQHIPETLITNLMSQVFDGSNIVFFDSSFASFNELNEALPLSPINYLSPQLSGVTLVKNNSTEGWAFYEGSGLLCLDKNDSINGDPSLFAINSSADIFGKLIYSFEPPENWNCSGQELMVWVKSNVAGDIYFDVGNNGKTNWPYEVWTDSKDALYRIAPGEENKWTCFLIPINQPDAYSGSFNSSNVSIFKVGMLGLSPNQPVDIKVSEVQMINPTSYTQNGTLMPLILHSSFGNGTISYVDLSFLSSALSNSSLYSKMLSDTANTLLRYLPKQVASGSSTPLPIPSDLFKYIIPAPASLYYLKGLNGFFAYNNALTINGDFVINSSNFYISSNNLAIKELVVSGSNGTLSFQNVTLKKVIINGSGTLVTNSSEGVIGVTPVETYMRIDIPQNLNGSLLLRNVEGEIEIQQDQRLEYVHISRENLTMLLDDIGYTMLVKQPTITVDGSTNGVGVGVLSYGSQFFSTASPEEVSLEGDFTFRVLYCPGQILAKILDISRMEKVPSD